MKILFINPPVWNDINKVLAETPPLGLLYLAAFVRKNGYSDIKVIDADAAEMTWSDLKNLLVKEKPDIVGVTGASFIFPAIVKTVDLVRKTLPNSMVIAGGFGSTNEPDKILKAANQAVNFIVLGEGELTFLELVQKIENKAKDFSQVKGLAYLDYQNNIIITPPRENIKDLNVLPWPDYNLLYPEFSDYKGMHAEYNEMSQPVGILLASRGCPHRCAFCSLGSKMYRIRDPKNIVDEIEFYKNQFGVKSIQIYDDEFIGMSPQQNKWAEEICDEIIKRGLNKSLSFLVQGRCSQFVKLDILKKMRQAGFVWIWWGVESGSQKILDFITKDIKVEEIVNVFSLAREANIKSMMYIMTGFPKETKEDINLTAQLIKKVKPDEVRIHILSPYPGSKLREYLEKHNLLETEDYYKFDSRINVVHHTKEMTAEEIKNNFRLLVFRFENGYWYFIKFWIKSLFSIDGWKKIPKRIKMIIKYVLSWVKISF